MDRTLKLSEALKLCHRLVDFLYFIYDGDEKYFLYISDKYGIDVQEPYIDSYSVDELLVLIDIMLKDELSDV